jgi:hypothetical protein
MLLDDTTLDVLKRCSQTLQAARRKGTERGEASEAVEVTAQQQRQSPATGSSTKA